MDSRIIEYQDDINRLKLMKSTYDKCQTLVGGFHSSMMDCIDQQLQFCHSCINNIKEAQKKPA